MDIKDRYFLFLLDKINSGIEEPERYLELLRRLHKKEFYYILPMDRNRAEDGRGLREEFLRTFNIEDPNEDLAGPPSVLEVLIALAQRCENDIVHVDSEGIRTHEWFWKWVANLGLLKFTDDTIVEWLPTGELDVCLEKWMDRKFEKHGKGSPWPLYDGGKYDVRKEEMWRQMIYWLYENVIFIEGYDGPDLSTITGD